MVCKPFYTVCISRQPGNGAGSQRTSNQLVMAGTQCLPAGIGRFGQSISTRLYSLSIYCWASIKEEICNV